MAAAARPWIAVDIVTGACRITLSKTSYTYNETAPESDRICDPLSTCKFLEINFLWPSML